jgi:hypothetical protein
MLIYCVLLADKSFVPYDVDVATISVAGKLYTQPHSSLIFIPENKFVN